MLQSILIPSFTDCPGGQDKSCMTRYLLLERFLRKAPMGDPTNVLKGGTSSGPALRPFARSLLIASETAEEYFIADGQLLDSL